MMKIFNSFTNISPDPAKTAKVLERVYINSYQPFTRKKKMLP